MSAENIIDDESKQEPTIPKKYQGKTPEQIIEMHVNAEKELSRQGSELGQLRKLTDQLIQSDLSKTKTVEEPGEAPDWEYEPEKAAKTLVNSEVGAVNSKLDNLEQKIMKDEFLRKHPDYLKYGESQEMADWAAKSKYRTKLYTKASEGNFEAADEIFTAWEEMLESQDKKDSGEEARKNNLKKASLEKGAGGGSSKKVWSRQEIVHMKAFQPSEYAKYRKEIESAYAEKRIKP